jgi:hypothetical protein
LAPTGTASRLHAAHAPAKGKFRVGGSEILYFKKYLSSSELATAKIQKKNIPATPAKRPIPPVVRADKGRLGNYKKKQKGGSHMVGERARPLALNLPGNRNPRENTAKAFNGVSASDHYKTAMDDKKATTDQEWCHLRGHGDGGPEVQGNLVAGSNHCNTEQLAIEIGQRRRTTKIGLNVTAYVEGNSGGKQHVAKFMRYKLYEPETSAKIFDHIYDAQNQGFDYNEFKILQTTVERVVSMATLADGQDKYEKARKKEITDILKEDLKYAFDAAWVQKISSWMERKKFEEAPATQAPTQSEVKSTVIREVEMKTVSATPTQVVAPLITTSLSRIDAARARAEAAEIRVYAAITRGATGPNAVRLQRQRGGPAQLLDLIDTARHQAANTTDPVEAANLAERAENHATSSEELAQNCETLAG